MPADVVVTSRSFASGDVDTAEPLRQAGLTVATADPGHDPADLAGPLSGAVAWIAGTGAIDAPLLDLAPGLRVIARYGTGTDAVDLEAAAARDVVVTRTPGANADSVADHTVALMLTVLRGTVAGDRSVRAGQWSQPAPGRELGALTVGLLGFGAVGRAVARRLSGFGSEVIAHDPGAPVDGDARAMSRDELLERADVLSLHLPAEGKPLVDEAFLAHMRPGAVLVNTARGSLLDEAAVAAALDDGRLAGLGTDVLAHEPATSSPLLDAPNVTVTPHVGANTIEAVDRMGTEAVAEVLRVLRGEAPLHPAAGRTAR